MLSVGGPGFVSGKLAVSIAVVFICNIKKIHYKPRNAMLRGDKHESFIKDKYITITRFIG